MTLVYLSPSGSLVRPPTIYPLTHDRSRARPRRLQSNLPSPQKPRKMMGLFNGLQNAGQQLRGKASRSSDDAAPEGSEPDETSVLCVLVAAHRAAKLTGCCSDENEGSIIASLISQLRCAPAASLPRMRRPTGCP